MIYKKFDYTDINKDAEHLVTLRSVSVRTGISTIDITNRITGEHIINRLSIEMYDETSSEYDDIHKFYKEYMDQCFGINKRAFDHNLILYKYEMDKRGNLHHTLEILL